MASPTIESLCCVSVNSDFSKGFLQDFQSVPYNAVSVVAAACGICGAAFQVCIYLILLHRAKSPWEIAFQVKQFVLLHECVSWSHRNTISKIGLICPSCTCVIHTFHLCQGDIFPYFQVFSKMVHPTDKRCRE